MNCSDRSAVRRRGPRFLEEPANGGEQCGRLFNVWNVARTVHYDQGCFRREGRCLGRRERNGILATVDDERRNGHSLERSIREQVEITETFPDRLLHATGDSKRCEIVYGGRIREVSGDTQLECSLAIGVRVELAQAGVSELRPQLHHRRIGLTPQEFRFELTPEFARDGSRIDEHESRRTVRRSAGGRLDREQ